MTALDQSRQKAVLSSEADSDFSQNDSVSPVESPAAGLDIRDCVQRINPEALLVLVRWHERRALDQDRFASNAKTALWRTGCERRASFHRMIGDYLRALHGNLLKLGEIVLDGERELPFADSTSVAPSAQDESAPAPPKRPGPAHAEQSGSVDKSLPRRGRRARNIR